MSKIGQEMKDTFIKYFLNIGQTIYLKNFDGGTRTSREEVKVC